MSSGAVPDFRALLRVFVRIPGMPHDIFVTNTAATAGSASSYPLNAVRPILRIDAPSGGGQAAEADYG